MLLNVPVDARAYLHPGSGILYSWALSPEARAARHRIEMPTLDQPGVRLGPTVIADSGLKYCQGSTCSYRYIVDLNGQRLSMEIDINRDLVQKGFFPIYVDDTYTSREELGWQGEGVEVPGRSGMYFEVSGLPKGEHPWEFWLRLGSPVDHQRSCPEPIKFKSLR